MATKDRRLRRGAKTGRYSRVGGTIVSFAVEVKDFEATLQERARSQMAVVPYSPSRSGRSMKSDAVALSGTFLPKDYGQAIAMIRASLGLSITELAKAASVKRQTVYAWIRGENAPQEAKRKRLTELYYISGEWNKLSSESAKEHIPVIGEWMAPNFKVEEIVSRLRNAARSRPVQDRRQSGLSALLAQHNINIDDLPDQDEQFDLMTGKADAFGDIDEQEDQPS